MNKMLKTKEDIVAWLEKYCGYSKKELIPDEKYGFIINASSSISICETNLKYFPVKFNKVNGDFNISNNKLVSLEGCPEIVTGSFSCNNNKLTSLEYMPKVVEKGINCSNNNLISLEHCPEKTKSYFHCSFNNLLDLKGIPAIIGRGHIKCDNNKLKSLIGMTQKIDGGFDCRYNKLKSLEFGPSIVEGRYFANNNSLETLLFIPDKIIGSFDCTNNPKLKNNQGRFSFEELTVIHKCYQIEDNYKKLDKAVEIKDVSVKKRVKI